MVTDVLVHEQPYFGRVSEQSKCTFPASLSIFMFWPAIHRASEIVLFYRKIYLKLCTDLENGVYITHIQNVGSLALNIIR